MAYYFPSSQSHAIQYTRTLVQILTNYLSDFNGFDSQRFIAQFVVDFAVAITTAENVQDDEIVVDQQSIKTQIVNESTAAPTNAVTVAPATTQVVNAQDITTNAGTVLVIWYQGSVTGSYIVNEMET